MINAAMRQWADEHIEDHIRVKLGDPNRRLSNTRTLRWGNQGSFSLEISSDKRGVWYDHESKVGGNSIDLFERLEGLSEESVEEFIRDRMGTDYKPDPAKLKARKKKAKIEREA